MWITELSELNKNANFTVKLSFLFNSENSVILRYTRNIAQLNSWPNTVITPSCAARIRELLTALFGNSWHIFDNETRPLVIV